jgi:hypothetical protein
MTLSTPSSSVPAASRVNVADSDICAVVCAASAGVHGALIAPHGHESTRLAFAFLLATVALVAAAVALGLDPTPAVSGAAASLLLAIAAAYLLSRTTVVPGLTQHKEPFDTVGVVTSCLELAAAVVAVRQPNPRRHR